MSIKSAISIIGILSCSLALAGEMCNLDVDSSCIDTLAGPISFNRAHPCLGIETEEPHLTGNYDFSFGVMVNFQILAEDTIEDKNAQAEIVKKMFYAGGNYQCKNGELDYTTAPEIRYIDFSTSPIFISNPVKIKEDEFDALSFTWGERFSSVTLNNGKTIIFDGRKLRVIKTEK
ncbi:exported hypothetical protein [Enterobacterales bacterium 8AC]|nr:exported hypothetical protein [Enterobacterales bacterium 8AC]